MSNTDTRRVVVLNTRDHEIIPGTVLTGRTGGTVGLITDCSTTLAGNFIAVEKRQLEDLDESELAIMKKYPDIITASDTVVFDEIPFRRGAIYPQKYIKPKYEIGDYVVGIANSGCATYQTLSTTPRLVGGVVRGFEIIPAISKLTYTYNIRYQLEIDVKYSIEQFRADGAQCDKKYRIHSPHGLAKRKERWLADVMEKDTIFVEGIQYNDEGLSDPTNGLQGSDRQLLWYIMTVLIIEAEMRVLTADNMLYIMKECLSCAKKLLFEKLNLNSPGLHPYETPLAKIAEKMFTALASVVLSASSTNLEEVINSSAFRDLFKESVVMSNTVCTIPCADILSTKSMVDALTDPAISGIHRDAFAESIPIFIIDVISGKYHNSANYLGYLSDQIYSAITSPIDVGTQVILDPDHGYFKSDGETQLERTLWKMKQDRALFKVVALLDHGCVRISPVGASSTEYTVPYRTVYPDNNVSIMDSSIFRKEPITSED